MYMSCLILTYFSLKKKDQVLWLYSAEGGRQAVYRSATYILMVKLIVETKWVFFYEAIHYPDQLPIKI